MNKMTYWEKDGEFLSLTRYRTYAKRASREKMLVSNYLIELGYVSKFSSEVLTGRPKNKLKKIENNIDQVIIKDGKVKIQAS